MCTMARKTTGVARHTESAGAGDGAIGGAALCRRLSATFDARVAQDPVLRPFFPGKTMKRAIEEFAAFLAQSWEARPGTRNGGGG